MFGLSSMTAVPPSRRRSDIPVRMRHFSHASNLLLQNQHRPSGGNGLQSASFDIPPSSPTSIQNPDISQGTLAEVDNNVGDVASNSSENLASAGINATQQQQQQQQQQSAGCVTHGGPVRDRYGIEVGITSEKSVYFDNEVVRGEVTITADREVVLENPMVLLLCRFLCKDPQTGRVIPNRYVTLVIEKNVMNALLTLHPGENKFKYDFTVPEYSPSSFRCQGGECRWTVRFVFHDADKGMVSVAALPLTKCTMLYPLPGFCPTAQAETQLLHGANVRVEARLPKDVYAPGEAVDCSLTIHQDSDEPLDVRKIKAKVMQYIVLGKKKIAYCYEKHEIDSARIMANSLQLTYAGGKGTVAERTFGLRPALNNFRNAAAYYRPQGFDGEVTPYSQRQPAPSCASRSDKDFMVVKYEVHISVKFFSTKSLNLVLPITIESDPALLTDHNVDVDDIRVFPRFELPPAYADLEEESLPSYTSLRKDSLDWILADENTGDKEADPASDELVPGTERPAARHSLGGSSSSGLGANVDSPKTSRRASGSGPSGDGVNSPRGRRRASSVAQGVLHLAGINEEDPHTAKVHAHNALTYRATKAARRVSNTLGRRKSSNLHTEALRNAAAASASSYSGAVTSSAANGEVPSGGRPRRRSSGGRRRSSPCADALAMVTAHEDRHREAGSERGDDVIPPPGTNTSVYAKVPLAS